MLVTWMNGWVWRPELTMICWDLGWKPDLLLESEDDLDFEPDREREENHEGIFVTVGLRVRKWSVIIILFSDVFVQKEFIVVKGMERANRLGGRDLGHDHER